MRKTKNIKISDADYLLECFDNLPSERVTTTIPEYSEAVRVFPTSSPFPGPHRFSRTPYAYEIAMELSPQSSTEFLNVEKAAQMGLTANTTESLLLYKIGVDPGPVLFMGPNEQFIKKWDESRIMPMIEASGMTHKLKSTYKRNSQHGGGGNTSGKKSWPGGRLDMLTYAQVNQLRNQSYQILVFEDAEERATSIQRGMAQGDFKKVAIPRTMTYAGRRKILDISTPILLQGSTIHPAFLEGDQRYYYIECPVCGHHQRLIWKNLKFEKDEHRKVDPESVYYECEHEGCHILEIYKPDFLLCEELGGTAKWIPHNAEKAKPKTKSWQISALYAGLGMIDWITLAQEFVDAQGDGETLQAFINLRLGEPFVDYSDAPPAEFLHVLKGSYKRGTLPNEKEGSPIIAMLGCDVQHGNKRGSEWVPGKEARIEASLWGYGLSGRSWLIEHYIIKGETTDYRGGAFAKLREMIVTQDFPIQPARVFIDASFNTDAVKRFANGSTNIFPIMGDASVKGKYFRHIELQEFHSADSSPLRMYELNTDSMKRRLYNSLILRQDPMTGAYPTGFCMFPIDIEHSYFEQLTAERPVPIEKYGRVVGYKFDAGGRANETTDCKVYADLAMESYILEMSQSFGAEASDYNSFWDWAIRKYGLQLPQKITA